MRLCAFEVRPDEEACFAQCARQLGIELELHREGLTLEKIAALPPNCCVSTLGMYHYGEAEMCALAERGVHAMSTRTVGYNHIDLEAAQRHDVHVCNAHYDPNGVADYTVMMLLLCLRKYKQALWRTQVNDFSLDGLIGREVKDLTVGVVGTGRIGAQVVRNLSGFGCRMLACDNRENASIRHLVTYVDLETVYRECDVITLHVPLLPDTYHMICDETIARMKTGVVLINCARGDLMDVQSLIRGIESQKIGALGLDVLEKEENIVHRNLKTDIISNRDMAYLRQFKNVVHTQHMAFYTDAAVESMVRCGVQGCVQMLRGQVCRTQLV